MALDRDTALQAIYSAIDEMNGQAEPDRRLAKTEDTIVFAEDGKLDSLGLVNLISAVEQHIMDITGDEVVLASESAMSRKRSPYRSVAALADFAVEVAASQEGVQ
jgi:acyl carrier protein